ARQPRAAADRAQFPLADRRADGAPFPRHPARRLLRRSFRRRTGPAAAALGRAQPRRRQADETAAGRGGPRIRRAAGARCRAARRTARGREPGAGAEAVAAQAVRTLPPRARLITLSSGLCGVAASAPVLPTHRLFQLSCTLPAIRRTFGEDIDECTSAPAG